MNYMYSTLSKEEHQRLTKGLKRLQLSHDLFQIVSLSHNTQYNKTKANSHYFKNSSVHCKLLCIEQDQCVPANVRGLRVTWLFLFESICLIYLHLLMEK